MLLLKRLLLNRDLIWLVRCPGSRNVVAPLVGARPLLDVFNKTTQQDINHVFNKMEGVSRIFNNADDDDVVQEHTRYHLYILHWLVLPSAQGLLQKGRDELDMLLT